MFSHLFDIHDDDGNPYVCKHCTFINDDKKPDIIACEACDEILPYFVMINENKQSHDASSSRKRKVDALVGKLDSLQDLGKERKNTISVICQACTYDNEIRLSNVSELVECEICKSKITLKSKVDENAVMIIKCSNCTFENNIHLNICEICNEPLPGYKNNNTKNSNNNNDNSNSNSMNNNNGILKYLNGQPSANKYSSEVFTESESFKSESATDGIIPLLEAALRKAGSNYRLCISFTHVSQTGVAEGCYWSCGYRNIQQLCTALMKIPAFKAKLFNGDGDIPDVNGLQAWIEKAWSAGFDTAGQQQLGGSLVGSDLWIGATECAALLRYFGLKAEVVDFSSSQDGSSAQLGDRLINWIKIYYDYCKRNGGLILPLYFQHDGHSRTIVGYEYNDKKTSILIFDPVSNGKTIKQKLLNCVNGEPNAGWQVMMKRGLHTMVKKDYQLVYVDEGIMSPELQELYKIINSSTDSVSKKELSKVMAKTINFL